MRTYAKKPGFYGKSLFLTHKYLRETGFAEFAFVSPELYTICRGKQPLIPTRYSGWCVIPDSDVF